MAWTPTAVNVPSTDSARSVRTPSSHTASTRCARKEYRPWTASRRPEEISYYIAYCPARTHWMS
ncbi:hypothetical protein SCANM63S_04444 [Streptomyces canarius]